MDGVTKIYLKGQLELLGIKNLTEKELNKYTEEFTALLQERRNREESDDESRLSSPSSLSISTVSSDQRSIEQTPDVAAEANTSTPGRTPAVYKSFPGDKENEIFPVAPTGSSSHNTKHVTLISPKRPPPKRKVLRKHNGVSLICDESLSDHSMLSQSGMERLQADDEDSLLSSSSDISSIQDRRPHTAGYRHDDGMVPGLRAKSFIRPSSIPPHNRYWRKADPVARYHEFKEFWDRQKPPGESDHSALRWQVREQCLQHDPPYYEPHQRTVKVNNFVAPTDKKRQSLRWEVRNQMAKNKDIQKFK
ncbi:centriolar and ciliogenesis-associated protein HYLS1-like [Dysidea avara]|uniref:centriolar and ciliogenesis-associated protein HYLS1-like n=1 Tax=Dysidea avara TaxID=196820 RepID=UPI0033206669